jgi:hypothetical protein
MLLLKGGINMTLFIIIIISILISIIIFWLFLNLDNSQRVTKKDFPQLKIKWQLNKDVEKLTKCSKK